MSTAGYVLLGLSILLSMTFPFHPAPVAAVIAMMLCGTALVLRGAGK